MPKIVYQRSKKNIAVLREETRKHYQEKFFNLWFNSYEWQGLNYEQRDFIMRQFWEVGKTSAWKILNADAVGLEGGDALGFSNYAPAEYNIYMNFPIAINLTPLKYAPFIPKGRLRVGKDCAIGYAQRNKLPIIESINYLIDKVVDAEMLINIIKDTLKMPYIIICNEEDKMRLNDIVNKILNDEPCVYLGTTDANSIKTLANNNPYILDKVYSYKQERENEILTYLGIDNVASEKKEHLIVDEVNANNDVINNSGDCCLDCLKEFCERVNEALNVNISVEATAKPIMAETSRTDEGGEGNEL